MMDSLFIEKTIDHIIYGLYNISSHCFDVYHCLSVLFTLGTYLLCAITVYDCIDESIGKS